LIAADQQQRKRLERQRHPAGVYAFQIELEAKEHPKQHSP
jgi:hypothetical protein